MRVALREAAPGQNALQQEMRRVWSEMDSIDDATARRVLTAVAGMRKDVLDRLMALPTVQIDGQDTYQSTALRTFAGDLDRLADQFATSYSQLLGQDMRDLVRVSDEAHRAALANLAQATGVPQNVIKMSPLGLSDAQIEAAVLLNQSAIKNVSQAAVSAINKEIQAVVFGGQSRWDAIRNIRSALATEGAKLGAITNRAMTIERTAMIQAFNVAADHAYRQAVEEFPELQVEWITAKDKRVDPICVGLSGAKKKPGGTFPGGYPAPPAHPRCRCRIVPVLPEWEKPVPKPKPKPKPAAAVEWSPTMTPQQAALWAKDSGIKEPIYHFTFEDAANAIEKGGFQHTKDVSAKGGGVFTTTSGSFKQDDIGLATLSGTKDITRLTLRANVKPDEIFVEDHRDYGKMGLALADAYQRFIAKHGASPGSPGVPADLYTGLGYKAVHQIFADGSPPWYRILDLKAVTVIARDTGR